MDRLSALDASFLYLEGPQTPMHISSVAIYEGPPPTDMEFRSMLERRLPLIPRFRQKLAMVPFGAHRPMWTDDDSFDLGTHLQRVALFEPTEEALLQLSGRILSQPLSRTRPMWEMWIITGLARDRFAILSKTHHSMWDGISGIDLHSVLLDTSPEPRDDPHTPFEPEPNPSGLGMLVAAARDRLEESVEGAKSLARAARDPAKTVRTLQRFARDATSFASSFLRPAPASELNAPIGPRRRYALARGSLTDVKDLKYTLGASVNDVILASVAGGLRHWQLRRGQKPRDVRVMVPVSVRNEDDAIGGNKVAMVVVPLPVTDKTSLMRLDRVRTAMAEAKRSGHVAAGASMTSLSGLLPPAGIAAMTRAQSVVRPFNLLVTNIAGPATPLYLLGRKLVELFPQAPLAANQGLSIAALSYNGTIGFGLLSDHDNLADLGHLAQGVESSLDDLIWQGALDVTTPAAPSLNQLAQYAGVR